mmetsp:Transcript_12593/g.41276  ORF Transcript_12593/g.41276 Transcript_12593/m.41276 type:complete len:1027 (-) Transcript_12593:628-3708(-)
MVFAILSSVVLVSLSVAEALSTEAFAVTRAVSEAKSVEDVLCAMERIPASDGPSAATARRRRLALTGAFQKLAQRCVGTGARETRLAATSDARFARGLALVAENDDAPSRIDALRFAAALTTQEPVVTDAVGLTARALPTPCFLDSRRRECDPTPSQVTGMRWVAERCAAYVEVPILEVLRDRERELELPFAVYPGLAAGAFTSCSDDVQALARRLPLAAETVVTRSGVAVRERRHTAWVAESDVGAMAYSGKLMRPIAPLPEPVARLADSLAEALPKSPRYDCALLNLYPDGGAACRYHVDPEHGTYWHRDQAVVSCGEPRRFAFRRLDDPTNEDHRHVFHLFHGDVVHMFGDCQDTYQHAVFQADDHETNSGQRLSFVMKHALLRPNGKKGHGGGYERRISNKGGVEDPHVAGASSRKKKHPPSQQLQQQQQQQQESAAYATLMRTVESLQSDLQETITTCHSLREANARLSKGYEGAKAEAVRQRDKFNVTRAQLVEATKAKIESDRNTELAVSKWKAQLDDRTKELDVLRGKLVPQDLDMLRIEIQEELEEPHQQRVADLESQIDAAQRAYFECRRDLETLKAESEQRSSSHSAAFANEKLRSDQAVEALRSRLQESEAKLTEAEKKFSKRTRQVEAENLDLRVGNDVFEKELRSLQKNYAEEKDGLLGTIADRTKKLLEKDAALTSMAEEKDRRARQAHDLEDSLSKVRSLAEKKDAEAALLKKTLAEAEAKNRAKEKQLLLKLEDARSELATTKKELEREKEDFVRFEASSSRRREALEMENAGLRRATSEARLAADALIENARAQARSALATLEDKVLQLELAKSDLEKTHEATLADAVGDSRKLEAQLKLERAKAARLDADTERTLKPRLLALERERDSLLASLDDLQRKADRLDDLETQARATARDLDDSTRLRGTLDRQIADLQAQLQRANDANEKTTQNHAHDLADLKKALKADRQAAKDALKAETEAIRQQADDKLRKERKRAAAYKDRALRERDRTSFVFYLIFSLCLSVFSP